MKYLLPVFIGTSLLIGACQTRTENAAHEHTTAAASDVAMDTVKKSIPKEVHALIAGTHFMIKYHAPAVRGRTIWGGLVPFGDVWVTGAHAATALEVDKPVSINGTTIPEGKYALFTIPGKEKWTVILNKNWDQHLADDYDANEDLIRLTVTPEVLDAHQERLKYTVTDAGNAQASVDIRWEKLKVSFPVQLNP